MNTDGSATIEVDLPVEEVWAAVSDPTRHPEWSAECVGVDWTGDATTAVVGATFIGHNSVADVITWDAPCRVTEVEPGRTFAYAAGPPDDSAAVWRWDLEAAGDGRTRVTHSFHAPDLLRPDYPFPGRDEMLQQGIESTLARLKDVLEGRAS